MVDDTGNRVWVQQSAIDAIRKPQRSSSFRRSSQSASASSIQTSFASDASDDASSLSHGRSLTWGWKAGTILEHTSGSIVVQLQEDLDDSNNTSATTSGDSSTIRLRSNALQEGDVVLANEYSCDAEGNVSPPHDLITLTHLHEPAVVESLQFRYGTDQIYTSTGPVLLALNPFQNVRGLYGEAVMKRYWEKSERNLLVELPPHVYSIADEAFRSMMRGLEDHMDDDNKTTANQSILVSGESGAGKTVTTKFVMKYLAALSQRSVKLHSPEKRAYAKVAELKSTNNAFRQPSWAFNNSNKNNKSPPKHSSSSVSRTDLQSLTLLSNSTSNSIEAQVLQSNPILESFGNARTVRNDNSSRFGKFIEIQFTPTGKLVGAQIETYLLEKVRLVTQSPGERNYHIFYELLSGAMDARELSQYFLAKTASPDDFKMTCSGTYDRRDGVSDKETYRQMRTAMNTMKFDEIEVKEIFSVTAAILHASNLNFCELPGDESMLDETNVHLQPVCHLLGVTDADLNQALCFFNIQAGKDNFVQRSLDIQKAEKGLEALLKATYGALFEYLVRRINDSIAFKENRHDDTDNDDENSEEENVEPRGLDETRRPASSIGVLDIFGFESFTKNSFEQLCINYCNEALQQQFNAFVLKNEQAEYEREGIEWAFIEFPENQDVLDLIEKRGAGILSILDDQCRAPGPSDKAFALDVYKQCQSSSRFMASRKQTASLQFSVRHYAGPVEYTAEGFTEKNRDELPKETTELLKNSSSMFVQELAYLMERSHEMPVDSNGVPKVPAKLHRADSSVGRATVGGQFRRQLRNLRVKIDQTSPHYVRCLKPNDHLVPDHFDTAIVAEQLRCGGILEAIRVARAGFTQHYAHEDFVRRYRALAWRELSKKDVARQSSGSPATSSWNGGTSSTRGGIAFRSNYVQSVQTKPEKKTEVNKKDVKMQCKELLRVLYRKIQQHDKQGDIDGSESPSAEPPSPSAKAKTHSTPSATPSWSKSPTKPTIGASTTKPPTHNNGVKARYTPWEKKSEQTAPTPSPPAATWRRGGVTTSDYAKVGIQMGKTKVFLRHKAFETLERIRSHEQTKAATLLNSVFRMYLARLAYIPYRDAFRREFHERRLNFEANEFKETKEQDYEDGCSSRKDAAHRFRQALSMHRGGNFAAYSLVDKWMESQIRDAIHNPVPRHQWGKDAPSSGNFKWVLSDGVWVKNYGYEEHSE